MGGRGKGPGMQKPFVGFSEVCPRLTDFSFPNGFEAK